MNQQGVIIQGNRQTEAMFGYTRDELIGQSVEVLVPERQRTQHHHHRGDYNALPKIRPWDRAWICTAGIATALSFPSKSA